LDRILGQFSTHINPSVIRTAWEEGWSGITTWYRYHVNISVSGKVKLLKAKKNKIMMIIIIIIIIIMGHVVAQLVEALCYMQHACRMKNILTKLLLRTSWERISYKRRHKQIMFKLIFGIL
jgi:hypothetical protein